MHLRKMQVKKRKPRVHNLRLYGITDKAEFANQVRNGDEGFSTVLNLGVRKQVREAMLAAEYRKGQAITLTRQMRYT